METAARLKDTGDWSWSTDDTIVTAEPIPIPKSFPDQLRFNTNAAAPAVSANMSTKITQPDLYSILDCGRPRLYQNEKLAWHERDRWLFIRSFTPLWFTANMGTGIVSVLLHNLPYNGKWLYWISVIIFAFNVILFVFFLAISVLRYLLYPGLWREMIHHPVLPLFLGAFPMALSTIIEMIVLVCVPVWGHGAVMLAWALWWVDAAISIATCYCIPFLIIYVHDIQLSAVTGAMLLPIAPAIVASAVGAVIAEVLVDEQHSLWTLVVCYLLWGTAVPLSMSCLVIYLHRLKMHNLPPREVIVSTFIPIAPLGKGAFAIMQMGKVAAALFPKTGTLGGTRTSSGDILYVVGWLIGFVMWAYGLAWLIFALASLSRGRFPFNLSWWAFTFPLGVWTSATLSFGQELPSRFFTVLGTVLSIIVTLLWLMVLMGTIRDTFNGRIFVAPDFKQWQEKRRAANTQSS